MIELKQILLEAPEGHIGKEVIDMIKTWDDEPTALQLLETLDACVHGGLTSGFVIHILETLLNQAIEKENTSIFEVMKLATWREKA